MLFAFALRYLTVQPEELYRLLQEQPFRPRQVYLKDGRSYDIPLREMVVVGRTYVDIGQQASDEMPGICAGIVSVDPGDIVRLETVADTTSGVE